MYIYMKCNLGKYNSSREQCIPSYKRIVGEGLKGILKKREGRIAKIIGEKSGADKGAVKNILFNGKYYFVYNDKFIGPPFGNKLSISNTKAYHTENGTSLDTVLREIRFMRTLQSTGHIPKIFISELFEKQKSLRIMFATEDLSRQGYSNVGKYIDKGEISLSFKNIPVDNNRYKPLERLLVSERKNPKYAAFMHPKYLEKNLEKWFDKNKKFLHILFKGLIAIHREGVFHHDLHAGNVWYNGKKIMFIDFGRASNLKESFESRHNEKSFMKKEKQTFSRVKNTHERRMLAELSKDKLNPTGRHEFFRHDVDDKIMVDLLYRNAKFYDIVHIFKRFLAKKYKIYAMDIELKGRR
jgi:serine/threonine protein kinase